MNQSSAPFLLELERFLLGVYEFGEVRALSGRPLPLTATETAPAASFRIVYLRRRKANREGDES